MKQRKQDLLAVAIFSLLFFFLFKDILIDANHKCMAMGGDGVKNMYTYLYHVLYGNGLWFDGMNYPYGEHVTFTDNQPLVAMVMAALNKVFHFSPGTILATMYYLMAASFVIGAFYTYRLLLHYKMPPAASIFFSALILMLSPQVYRLTGHFPLAYSTFIPMLFYWTVRYYEGERKRYAVQIFLLLLAYSLLHMYFMAMGILWVGSYTLGYWLLQRRPALQKAKHTGIYLAAGIMAFAAMQLIFKLSDPVKDRPVYPLSSPVDRPLWEISNSNQSPFWNYLKEQAVTTDVKDPREGGAYFGLATMALIVVGIGRWLVLRIKKKDAAAKWPTLPYVFIFIAVFTTLFALLATSIWDWGIFKILLKPLRQFRALQRLTWIGYYVFSVYAALLLWRIYSAWQSRQRSAAAFVLAGAFSFIWLAEAWGNVTWLQKADNDWQPNSSVEWNFNYKFFFNTDGNNWQALLKKNRYKPTDFQAIITLPLVHVGSEKLAVGGNVEWGLTLAFSAAIQLHLPVMDVNMSRTGWQQTFGKVKLEGGIIADKPILEQLPDARPLLLMHFNDYAITPDEKDIYAASDSLGSLNNCSVYAFSPRRYLARRAAVLDSLRQVAAVQPVADSVYGSTLPLYANHYDSQHAPYRFAGTGSMPPIVATDSVILSWQLPATVDSQQYELSAWSRYPDDGYSSNYYVIYCKDSTGKDLQATDAFGTRSTDNAPGLWFCINAFFTIPAGTKRIEVKAFNPDKSSYLAMDELLLRPVEATVISKRTDGTILVNNHLLKPAK